MVSNDHYAFQYCQKLVILDKNLAKVLLARRSNEADYNGVYSFIGGKMETSDESFVAGMHREKVEEIGAQAIIDIIPDQSRNILYTKKDGSVMILPHIAGIYRGGEIVLNTEEYQESKWVEFTRLSSFEPKIHTIYEITLWAQKLLANSPSSQFVRI